ncbi:protein N-terminal asparagine amidohydrolase [Syzygium oleosum]|uniref:protein N-terminal asparagine amidohydrolase n=1 Tax=Syzygium oleosum TaxID=219896 RepID=UPI0011D21029|nr:protein N-terminal asparagine amidohydrolase [Syzygium oleosum]
MILVDGVPILPVSDPDSPSPSQVLEILAALLDHPSLLCALHLFKNTPERRFSISEESGLGSITQPKCVYVFQREYAIVDPAFVDVAGTDEATTCVGLIIRNRSNGKISIAHLDSPDIVEMGLAQMLSQTFDHDLQDEMDVHLIGGFEDASLKRINRSDGSEIHGKVDGYSLPLCIKLIETLWRRQEKFHIQTFFVLGHNTRWDADGHAYPIITGFLVETSNGSVFPACFDRSSRCPDEVVRRIRITACNDDSTWRGKLLETYHTQDDKFIIAPCYWSWHQFHIALTLQHLSDSQILLTCSTSPYAEGPDFVDNERRQLDYIIKHPDWRETFPKEQPRVFERNGQGGWRRCGD